jgi:hypothetical protein
MAVQPFTSLHVRTLASGPSTRNVEVPTRACASTRRGEALT